MERGKRNETTGQVVSVTHAWDTLSGSCECRCYLSYVGCNGEGRLAEMKGEDPGKAQ